MRQRLSTRRLLGIATVLGIVILAGVLVAAGSERTAATAEEAYVSDRLADASCLDTWGTDEGTETRRAAVTGLTPGGVRVSVRMPYAYSVETEEGPVHADTAANAVYVVSLSDTRRVEGTQITPC